MQNVEIHLWDWIIPHHDTQSHHISCQCQEAELETVKFAPSLFSYNS